VVVGDAPLAPYEGVGPFEVTFPVRVLKAMGAELLVLTAGAASLTHHLEPGSVAVIEDHLNFTNLHPLQGPPDEQLGPRFPDMTDPYPQKWRLLAREVGAEIGFSCLSAVFAAVPGPSLPTRAEYRFLRRAGADLVGMSLVPEVLAAVHSGLDVLALCGITQHVQVESTQPVDIEEMLDAADLAAPRMASMLTGIVARLD
jgi:purine-nucleoside phosphorylase